MSVSSIELKNEVVRAGAGAGKTTKLTDQVLQVAKSFKLQHGRWPRVVVTTFTRKATEELRERLVKKATLANDNELIELVTGSQNLSISTIHGVLSQFLRTYGSAFGIDAGFQILEGAQENKIKRRVLRDLLVKYPECADLLTDFRFSELQRVLDLLLPDLTMGHDATGVDKNQIYQSWLLAFEKSKIKVLDLIGSIERQTTNDKWQKYASEIQNKLALGFCEFSDLEKPKFVKNCGFEKSLKDEFDKALDEIKELPNEIDVKLMAVKFAKVHDLVSQLAGYYESELRAAFLKMGMVAMSDLENLTAKIVRQEPSLARSFAKEWDYWMVDEFQDTSPLQVDLLEKLRNQKPMFVVGDPQQSIYLFRGARSEVFAEYEKAVIESGGQLSKLDVNYRSRPELLEFFNDFFSKFGSQFQPMNPKNFEFDAKSVVARFVEVDPGAEVYSGVLDTVEKLLNTGVREQDICILARTTRELRAVASQLEQNHIPSFIHAIDGFYERREVVDMLSILRFLVNPHDNHNFLRLLRSPWFVVDDQMLVALTMPRPASYWVAFFDQHKSHPVCAILENLLSRKELVGPVDAWIEFIVNQELIQKISTLDSTGRKEANLWKLISLIKAEERQPGFQTFAFLQSAFFERDASDGGSEGDATSVVEPNRINLMTIHKSKGLKFSHVILLNAHTEAKTTYRDKHKQLVVVDEKTKQFSVVLRSGTEEKLTHTIWAQEVLKGLSDRELNEHERLLYVAFTRASESVTLHWQNKNAKNSWISKIKWNFGEGVTTGEKYSYEYCRYDEGFIWARRQTKNETHLSELRPVFELKDSPVGFAKLPRYTVTSLLEEQEHSLGKKTDFAKVEKEESKEAGLATQRLDKETILRQMASPVIGSVVHQKLERLRYATTTDDMDDSDVRETFDFVLNLQTPPMKELLQTGEVEWGFQLKTERGILEGQIDLWGRVGNDIWVIDYKTGSSRYSEKAFQQLEHYANALQAMGHQGTYKLAVIYTRERSILWR